MNTKQSWNKKAESLDSCWIAALPCDHISPWTKRTYQQLVGSVVQAVKLHCKYHIVFIYLYRFIPTQVFLPPSLPISKMKIAMSSAVVDKCHYVPDFLNQPSRLFKWSIGDRPLDCFRGWCDLLASFVGGWLLTFHEDRLGRIWMINSKKSPTQTSHLFESQFQPSPTDQDPKHIDE